MSRNKINIKKSWTKLELIKLISSALYIWIISCLQSNHKLIKIESSAEHIIILMIAVCAAKQLWEINVFTSKNSLSSVNYT